MPQQQTNPATAFEGHTLLCSGPLLEVAMAVKAAMEDGSEAAFLVFDDATGRVIDLDLRGSREKVAERLPRAVAGAARAQPSSDGPTPSPEAVRTEGRRGPGRPRLGVVAREVTLLPRHWAWLADQPGGASAALRRLVDEARRTKGAAHAQRTAHEAAYRFMTAIGGDLPGYEEALRALFANDRTGLEARLAAWPEDVRTYALRLAYGATSRRDGEGPSEPRNETS